MSIDKELMALIEKLQWGFNHRRCPLCAGWDPKGNGETDYRHTKDCPVARAPAGQATGGDRCPHQRLQTQVCDPCARYPTAPQPDAQEAAFQARVGPWLLDCFGIEVADDIRERGDRLLEEVLELLQSHGYDPGRVATLRDYVFNRSVGEPEQEAGGVMVTLAAYCCAARIDMHKAGEKELARILRPEVVERIRKKQARKRGLHTPLPIPPTPSSEAGGECEVRLWDSQWVNIVNHDNCYRDYDIDDAVAKAVRLTEEAMAHNARDGSYPPPRNPVHQDLTNAD